MEGMSSWLVSLSEVLVLAKELNATLVEPCILKGRLGSCANVAQGGPGLRLSQVLDMQLMQRYHAAIVSYQDYEQAIRSTDATIPVVSMCLHHFSPVPHCEGAPHVWGAKDMPQLDQALMLARNSTTVLEIHQYGKFAFRKSTWANALQAALVKKLYLGLSTHHMERVKILLERMGLHGDEPFSVIHWRAERPGMDYLACADKILEVRDVIIGKRQEQQPGHQQKQHQHPFIIMSSLNTNADYMWKGAKLLAENSTSDQALRKLLDHGFLKLDQVVDYKKLKDPLVLAIYDLILALKAAKFVTCSKSCGDDSVCAACNWLGQFGGLAMTMRSDMANKSSTECWPSLAAR